MKWTVEEKIPVLQYEHYRNSNVNFDSFLYWQMLGRFYTDAKIAAPKSMSLDVQFIKQDEKYLELLKETIMSSRSTADLFGRVRDQIYREQVILYRLIINYEIL